MTDEDARSTAAAEDLRLYRAYFESSASGIFVYESDGRLLDVNSAACRMHGFSRKQMLAMDPREFMAPESRHVFDAFLRTLSTGEPFIGEARGLRRDGSGFDAEVEAHLITIGGRRHFFASFIDISDQRRAEEELRHRADYQALVAELSSSLLKVDPAAMDAPIEAALARIGDVYDIDYCFFWSLEDARWVQTHRWTVEPLRKRAAEWPRVLSYRCSGATSAARNRLNID